ncbi:MAG: hypothetical protein EOP06_00095 [Proteobacteria bacterium]|nr:MAG: hypothetical protein EOP06_00095 [Pseudomonadota bacterium]
MKPATAFLLVCLFAFSTFITSFARAEGPAPADAPCSEGELRYVNNIYGYVSEWKFEIDRLQKLLANTTNEQERGKLADRVAEIEITVARFNEQISLSGCQ